MYVYKYDLNNIYTSKEAADIDPLESEKQGKNIYLIPANATKTAPKEKSGFANVWTGDAWELVADNRGVKYWPAGARNGDMPQVMAELGPLPDGASLNEPEKTTEEIAAEELEVKKQARAAAVAAIVVNIDGINFDGDETAQARMARTITGAQALGIPMTDTVQWMSADNTAETVTLEQLARALAAAGEKQTELWFMPYQ